MEFIEMQNITKQFKIYEKKPGIINSLKSLLYRKYQIKKALSNISFSIKQGEMVGYIGPNGAGKSTTIKILSGILIPTSGNVIVNGIVPFKNRRVNALRIGVVFGQRTHLHWDLPVIDSYNLYKKMYKIDGKRFKENLDFFMEKLAMKDYINKPVRTLSLGQKMRAEIASVLLHDPDILYLDEPTIGLDVMAKSWIREFLHNINKKKKITVILTTHDMDDIEKICRRLIIIDQGVILYDGQISDFKKSYGGECMVLVDFLTQPQGISRESRLTIVKEEGLRKHFSFRLDEINLADVITFLSRNYNIKDLSIKEPEIETIVKKFYEDKVLKDNR